MNAFLFDLRSALRGLRATPGFTVIAILTVALGVGANTAIFSLFHGVLLAPLPYPSPEEIVRIWPGQWMTKGWILSFREAESFSAVSGYSSRGATLSGANGEPLELYGGEVTASHFDVVGVAPRLGRVFGSDDERHGSDPVVVISHRLWKRAFGSDPDIVGRTVDLADRDAARRRVVGVMPEGHRPLLGGWDFWIPITFNPANDYPDSQLSCLCWRLAGRMASGTTAPPANGEVATIGARIQAANPDRMAASALATAEVVPMLEDMTGNVRQTLSVLLAAVGLVLLIAIANVANLQLARAESRRHELGVRGAVGAGRLRLLLQTLVESVLVGLGGGALGVALALALVSAYSQRLPDLLPRSGSIGLDLPVLGFAVLATLVASMLFGLAPALLAVRTAPAETLMSHRATASRRRQLLRSALVAWEVGLAVVLVIGAGLMARTLSSMLAVDPGFRHEGLLTFRVNATGDRYDEDAAIVAFYERLEEQLLALPGVTRVADTMALPLSGRAWGWQYSVDTEPVADGDTLPSATFLAQSPDLFAVLGVRLLAGRDFSVADHSDAEPITIVSESFAKRHFGGPHDALGHVVTLNTGRRLTIVGVAADLRHEALSEPPRPTIYRPSDQFPTRHRQLVLQTEVAPSSLTQAAKQTVWDIDPAIPVLEVQSMGRVISASVGRSRLYTQLLSVFAGLALLLGLIGIYGVLAHTVIQRRRTIGIRLALGATARRVLLATVGQGLVPTLVGLALGLISAIAATGLLQEELFGVGAHDPWTFLAVTVLVTTTAAGAAYLPARRAAAVDPMETLRSE